jgi:hypothetical protein
MLLARILFALLFTCCIYSTSFSQTVIKSTSNSTSELFAGSTPCDSLIKVLLNIPLKNNCDFINWELTMTKGTATFVMTVHWGESQPNTNWFRQANKIEIKGEYAVSNVRNNLSRKLYRLSSDKFQSPVLLIRMDDNILHFADSGQNFITGNGGWGYVLNRIQQP